MKIRLSFLYIGVNTSKKTGHSWLTFPYTCITACYNWNLRENALQTLTGYPIKYSEIFHCNLRLWQAYYLLIDDLTLVMVLNAMPGLSARAYMNTCGPHRLNRQLLHVWRWHTHHTHTKRKTVQQICRKTRSTWQLKFGFILFREKLRNSVLDRLQ
jgi:hypothetical protein